MLFPIIPKNKYLDKLEVSSLTYEVFNQNIQNSEDAT